MINDFDQFPVNDPIIKHGTDLLSGIWQDFIATFYMNIIQYLTSGGILVPQITQAQINTLQNVQNGQMVYNTTINAPQIYQAGAWMTFTTS
jgi:hypothetical protein